MRTEADRLHNNNNNNNKRTMQLVNSSTCALHPTRLLLAFNKSSGYRWSPIPKPPPPHYDRLYGVHAVLNTLRVAAASRQKQQKRQAKFSLTPSTILTEGRSGEKKENEQEMKGSRRIQSSAVTVPRKNAAAISSLHPHRAHLSCLYVRDFSVEEEEERGRQCDGLGQKKRTRTETLDTRKKKIIPARYTAVRCISALAKSLDVPVRFVPRSELVQLCGERRNQNVVLEVSNYVAHEVRQLADIWRLDMSGEENVHKTNSVLPPSPRELVLFLEHIIDPTNIGGILRTAFFFGVDHVILSRDCAACTATVSRTSTGFLEYLRVHRATVSTADFLRASLQDGGGGRRTDVIASAVVSGVPSPSTEEEAGGAAREMRDSGKESDKALNDLPRPCHPNVRLLLLGNEDAGLPQELMRWCTHVAHVRSPRQLRLRQARINGSSSSQPTSSPNSEPRRDKSIEMNNHSHGSRDDLDESHNAHPHFLSEVEKREHNLQRLARLREKEVSLNVNTATAALLTALVAVEGELPRNASLGMVEVQACTS